MPAEASTGDTAGTQGSDVGRHHAVVLLSAVLVAAVCGLIYELVAGALSSYLLGGSVTQFSLVIGVFLCAMGLGSFLSRFIRRDLIAWFIGVEVMVGLIGGATALAGFAIFAYTSVYQVYLFLHVVVVGTLIGLEVPLVLRILKEKGDLRVSVANVMTFDYVGALIASVLFPFLLLPHVGLIAGALLAGLANVGVAWVAFWVLRREVGQKRGLIVTMATLATILLGSGLAFGDSLSKKLEATLFDDPVIYAERTRFQHIAITRWRDDTRLYLDGALQFSSTDEYRYHESLAHPAMAQQNRPKRVLILGGGDGMVAREVFKYPNIEAVDLVDLDPAVTTLFKSRELLASLNGNALKDPRLKVINTDAMAFLMEGTSLYDVIIADLPDPNNLHLSKLYTRQFYRLMLKRLGADGVFVSQAANAYRTKEAFWCIVHTLSSVTLRGPSTETLRVKPYTVHVPSFGQWGFVMASRAPLKTKGLTYPEGNRFLTSAYTPTLFTFGKDQAEVPTPVNTMDDHALVRLYRQGYSRYNN